jgi:hypothetical protein
MRLRTLKSSQIFKSKIKKVKLKNQKHIAIDVLQGLSTSNSHADPIWPNGTFKEIAKIKISSNKDEKIDYHCCWLCCRPAPANPSRDASATLTDQAGQGNIKSNTMYSKSDYETYVLFR